MRFIKQLEGKYVELEIIGKNKQEVIDWRNYFFNWGAIQISKGNCLNLSFSLENQERDIDEKNNQASLKIYMRKQALINTFFYSSQARVNWEKVTERGGQQARKEMHKRIERAAQRRFERIPTPGSKIEV